MGVRFECPRCQTVFANETAGPDAFAECPNCGSLALPAGDETMVDGQAFSQPSTGIAPADVGAAFAGVPLQPDVSAEALVDAHKSSPIPRSLFPTDEGLAFSDSEPDAPSLPDAPPLGTDEDPIAAFRPADAGVHIAPSFEAEATRTFDAANLDIDSEFQLDSSLFDDAESAVADQPLVLPPEAMTPVNTEPVTSEGEAIPEFGLTDEGGPPGIVGNLDDPTMPLARPILAGDDIVAAFPKDPVDPKSVTLADLEMSLHSDDEVALSPFSEEGLGDEAFKDLEAAFDEAALHPTDPQQAAMAALRQDSGEDLMQLAQSQDFVSAPAQPAPAAPDLKRRTQRQPHLTLSPEAIALVAVPIREADVSGKMRQIRSADAGPAITNVAATPKAEPKEEPRETGRTENEARANVASPGPQGPKPFRLSAALIAAIVLMTGAGFAVGAVTAPGKPSKGKARDTAEKHLITGNQYYEAARFDDASAAYARAAAADPKFPAAHLALGAALVKQGEPKDAIEAYREFLSLDDISVEADTVRKIIAAYDKKKNADEDGS